MKVKLITIALAAFAAVAAHAQLNPLIPLGVTPQGRSMVLSRVPPVTALPAVPRYTPSMPLTGTIMRMGDMDFYNFSNGVTGNRMRVGDMDFYNFSNGVTGNRMRVGDTDFFNFY